MKEQYKKIVSYIKKTFTRNSVKRSERRAMHDWLVSLSVACVCVLIFCVAGVYTFFFFHSAPSDSDITVPPQVTFSSKTLSRVVEAYRDQAKTHKALQVEAPSVPLPGIQKKTLTDEEAVVDDETLEAVEDDEETPYLQ